MYKTFLLIGVIVLAGIAGFFGLSRNRKNQSAPPAASQGHDASPARPGENRTALPDLAFQDYSGKSIRLADFKGKALVVNAWASWCPFCVKELPDFALVQKEFGDQVVIVAVDRAESRDVAKNYTDKLGVTPALTFLLDPSDSFYKTIGGFSMPETILVDKEGNIREHKRGPMDAAEMRQKIFNLLALEPGT